MNEKKERKNNKKRKKKSGFIAKDVLKALNCKNPLGSGKCYLADGAKTVFSFDAREARILFF